MLLTEIHQECADRNYWSPHEIEINRIQNDLDWIHSPKHFYTGRIYRKTPGDQFRTFGQGLNLGDSTPLEPSAIAGVQSAIEQAQWILSLPAYWDENGAEPIIF
ncbi:MAG: hypothetical protein JWO59_3543 [Chloroflexi bacterium]|nr:hypothetical protein [Chloroflexota bacterium]